MQNFGMYGDSFSPSSGGSFYGEELRLNAKRERHEIRLLGTVTGAVILFSVLLENILVLPLIFTKTYDVYLNDMLLRTGIDIIISILSLLLPFAFGAKVLKKISGTDRNILLDSPADKSQFLLAIPAGLGFCMIANRVSSVIIMIMSMFGLELSSPDIPMPNGLLGMTASFFRVVAVAAIIEELCFRGFVMQNLRKFGDWFAIVVSAFVFGMMHCNLIQAPFALIAGIALGYLSVKTNSLWTGIVIHALNNFLSLAVSYLMNYIDETAAGLIYSGIMSVLTVVGLICFAVFYKKQRATEYGMKPSQTHNGFWSKVGAFFSNPTMIITLGIMFYLTSTFVKKAG